MVHRGLDGVDALENGAHVYFGGFRGTMAERVVADPAWCFPVPDGLNDEKAATLLTSFVKQMESAGLITRRPDADITTRSKKIFRAWNVEPNLIDVA